jgi:hypothetical protein
MIYTAVLNAQLHENTDLHHYVNAVSVYDIVYVGLHC